MNKKILALVFLCLLAVSFTVTVVCGDKYSGSYDITQSATPYNAEDLHVVSEDPSIVSVSNVRREKTRLMYDLTAHSRGKTFLLITVDGSETPFFVEVYVHTFNIITVGSFFGRSTGGFLLPLSMLIMTVLLFIDRVIKYRIEMKISLYRYRNILNFGVLIFMVFLINTLLGVTLRYSGLDNAIGSVLGSAQTMAYVVLPIAATVSVLVSLSNLDLMRKEGVNWRNMLGFILGLGLCLATLFPEMVYRFLMQHQLVDIYNERGFATQLYAFFEKSFFFIIAYLECVLVGTVVFGIKAARHIPAFDKDYILILGCKIRADGTLPPLLRARADKAMEFAEKQKNANGKDIIFVPSGGKGEDECMAEAEAIKNYLISKGIPEERILPEDQSASTQENIRNSMALIQADFCGEGTPKVAFSTTNYHVFRAGLIASEQGYRLEGVGSPTKPYFWINAFIREFIATLVSQRKRHLKVILLLLIGVFAMVTLNYISILL